MEIGTRKRVTRVVFWFGFLIALVSIVSGGLSGSILIVPFLLGFLLMLPHLYLQFQAGRERTKPGYPIYDRNFMHNLTWECTSCGQEIYWQEDDPNLICHKCITSYSLTEDEFPKLLQAKCWNCGKISPTVGGFRAENIQFDCPNCEFEWKSSPW